MIQELTLYLIIRFIKIEAIENLILEKEQQTVIKLHLMKKILLLMNIKYIKKASEDELIGNLKRQIEKNIPIVDEKLQSLK